MICAFTGHRPQKLKYFYDENASEYLKLKETLRGVIEKKIEEGIDTFFTGMALGVDMLAAEAVLEVKKTHSDITLIAVIPCVGQENKWSEENRKKYASLVLRCDSVVTISERYNRACMHIRNRYLVDRADSMIAVWDGSPGGTGGTVALAEKRGIPITVIDPWTFEISQTEYLI